MPEAYGIRIIDLEGAEDRKRQRDVEVQHARSNRVMVLLAQEVCTERTERCMSCGVPLFALEEWMCRECQNYPESIRGPRVHCTECGVTKPTVFSGLVCCAPRNKWE